MKGDSAVRGKQQNFRLACQERLIEEVTFKLKCEECIAHPGEEHVCVP